MASKFKKLVNVTRTTVLADNARLADSFVSRLVGLLTSPPLLPGQGLIIDPCSSVHMFGMSFPIDVIFFDKQWNVVGLEESLVPGRISKMYPSAKCCVELPAGTIADTTTRVGDRVEVTDLTA